MEDKNSQKRLMRELAAQIERNGQAAALEFQPLDEAALNWRPKAGEWSVLECFEHLNLTHEYYRPRIEAALDAPALLQTGNPDYQPSFWGRIYTYFAFNPRYSFPTAPEITPGSELSRAVLGHYLARLETALDYLERAREVDLRRTMVPIAGPVRFNLGDCLRVLAYHDELHIRQARRVLALHQR